MKIILMRHGQAEDYQRPDDSRQLTEFGRKQAEQTAKQLLNKYRPDRCVVSPYDRARQTLNVWTEQLPDVPVHIQANITPSDNAQQALNSLSEFVEQHPSQCLLVVCHMPIVARLSALLTGGYPESFALAEARVFDIETDIVAENMATQIERFIPVQP